MSKTNGFKEEYEVFKVLCPDCIKTVINDKNIAYPEYIKIIKMFEELGFTELAASYMKSHFKNKIEKTKELTCIIAGEDLKIFCGEDSRNINYIRLFVDNIKSKGLKKAFYEQAALFCMDDGIDSE